jgi:hypothetical protein
MSGQVYQQQHHILKVLFWQTTVLNADFAIPQEFTRFVQSRGVHLSGILEPIKRFVRAITRQTTKIPNKDE